MVTPPIAIGASLPPVLAKGKPDENATYLYATGFGLLTLFLLILVTSRHTAAHWEKHHKHCHYTVISDSRVFGPDRWFAGYFKDIT